MERGRPEIRMKLLSLPNSTQWGGEMCYHQHRLEPSEEMVTSGEMLHQMMERGSGGNSLGVTGCSPEAELVLHTPN